MSLGRLIAVVAGFLTMIVGAWVLFLWFFCRVTVGPNEALVVIAKSGKPLEPGQTIAEAGEQGIQRLTYGPGRYFFNPISYETQKCELITISAGDPSTWVEFYSTGGSDLAAPTFQGQWPEVGVVTSLAGKQWTGTSEIVDKGYQGKQREVLTPGTYRINPRAYKIDKVPAVIVPVGFVGVVTSQLGEMPGTEEISHTTLDAAGNPQAGRPTKVQKLAQPGQRGVLQNVLPPGIYYLNPYVHKVTTVQVGYNLIGSQLISQQMQQMLQNVSVRAKNAVQQQQQMQIDEDRGQAGNLSMVDGRMQTIEFPSKDGFTVDVEVTVVWGRQPTHAPELINRVGESEKIRDLIVALVRSICRNVGSEYISTDFIEGLKREQYQREVTETLKKVCAERKLEILIALINNIEVHARGSNSETADLKETIQRGFIANEQDLTRQKQRETAVVKADLQTAEASIAIAREQITADTRKRVAETQALARKKSEEIDAARDLDVAQIEREIAEIEAETARVLGRAEADVQRLKYQAEADGRRMLVEAFGSGTAYNLYTFAQNFKPDSIRLIFAGEGTFWTDMNKAQDLGAMELLREGAAPPGRP